MTPEGKVKLRVKKLVLTCKVPVYLFMPVQRGMGESALDFMGCINGLFFGIETKAKSGKMTARQKHTAEWMAAAGGRVFLLNEEESDWQKFEEWLNLASQLTGD